MEAVRRHRLLPAAWLALVASGVLLGLLVKGHGAEDRVLSQHVVAWRSASATGIFRALTAIGSPSCVAAAWLLCLIGLLALRCRRDATFLALAYPGSALLVNVVKVIVVRPRPQLAPLTSVSTSGFPSGHAAGTLSVIGAMLIVVVARRGRRAWPLLIGGFVLVVAIGLSRVYLGVHYPGDVLGGWLLAAGWLGVLRFALRFTGRSNGMPY